MLWWKFYCELKGWQSAIGSLLGFAALLSGALYNSKLNRRRDVALREDEALSIAAALYGEILLLQTEVARISARVAYLHVEEGMRGLAKPIFDKHFLMENTISEPTLYKSLAPKIGLLSPELNIAITKFHQNVQDVRFWIPLMVEDPARGYSYSRSFILRPARDAVTNVQPALRQIEQMVGISTPAAVPDLGKTDFVIELEDLGRDERE